MSKQQHVWREANVRLVPSGLFMIIGAAICYNNGGVRVGNLDHKFVAFIGLLIFVFFVLTFWQVLTKAIYRLIAAHRLGVGKAASVQFVLRLVGYVAIFLMILDLVRIPIGSLLLGGAAIGIILGVAAQQALANFFASIVLIISHPFAVGENITIMSGALGGKYIGKVIDIGLAHTRLEDEDGNQILLPNATLLSGATITMIKSEAKKAD